MANNITVTYAVVEEVTRDLNAAVLKIVPELTTMERSVSSLLETEGGLWMQQSSPVLRQQYQAFNTSVTEAVNNINNFSKQFNAIVNSLREMDANISKSGK
jgi:hypothetical protein